MKSMPIGRKKNVVCSEDNNDKDEVIKIRRDIERGKDSFLKKRLKEDQERMKRWQEEVDDDVAPI